MLTFPTSFLRDSRKRIAFELIFEPHNVKIKQSHNCKTPDILFPKIDRCRPLLNATCKWGGNEPRLMKMS